MHTARAAPEAADKEWIPRILDFSIDAPRFYSPHTARGSSSLAGIRRFQASPRLQSLTAGPLGLGHRAWAWSSDWPTATVDRALLDRSDRSRPGRSQRRLHPVASEGSHGRTPRGAGSDGAARVLEAPQPGLDGILPGRPVPGTVRYLARPGAPAHPHETGIFSLAAAIAGLLSTLRSCGLSSYIVRAERWTRRCWQASSR